MLVERFAISQVATDVVAAVEHVAAACIVLPDNIHRAATEALVELGPHILIEKLRATDAVDCASVERAARVLAVTIVPRFAPSSRMMKTIVETEMLGQTENFQIVRGLEIIGQPICYTFRAPGKAASEAFSDRICATG